MIIAILIFIGIMIAPLYIVYFLHCLIKGMKQGMDK
jgi:hypothetical protein